MPGLQQEITIPGTKKKVPLKVILLGGAAILILFLLSRRGQSGQTAAAPSEDGLLAEEYNQRLQDQYNALSELVTSGQTQPNEPITAPLEERLFTIPPGEIPPYSIPDYSQYAPVPPAVVPQTAYYAPGAETAPMEARAVSFGATPKTTIKGRLPSGEMTFLKIKQEPNTPEEIARIHGAVVPTNYLALRGEKPSSISPVTVGRGLASQVGTKPIDRLDGKPTFGNAPTRNAVPKAPAAPKAPAVKSAPKSYEKAKPAVKTQIKQPSPKAPSGLRRR